MNVLKTYVYFICNIDFTFCSSSQRSCVCVRVRVAFRLKGTE